MIDDIRFIGYLCDLCVLCGLYDELNRGLQKA
jgi:hypothetical protein